MEPNLSLDDILRERQQDLDAMKELLAQMDKTFELNQEHIAELQRGVVKSNQLIRLQERRIEGQDAELEDEVIRNQMYSK